MNTNKKRIIYLLDKIVDYRVKQTFIWDSYIYLLTNTDWTPPPFDNMIANMILLKSKKEERKLLYKCLKSDPTAFFLAFGFDPQCLVVHNSLYEALFFAFISYKIAGPLTSNL